MCVLHFVSLITHMHALTHTLPLPITVVAVVRVHRSDMTASS